MALLAVSGSAAQTPVSPESRVKAAYLLKFPGFVEWPPATFGDATSPFVIAVAGAEDVEADLRSLSVGRTAMGRPVQVQPLTPDAPVTAQLIFIGKRLGHDAGKWIERYRTQPVLTVTEVTYGLREGSMLNFVNRDGRIRFEASPQAAGTVGIKLGSQLLSVAVEVEGPPR